MFSNKEFWNGLNDLPVKILVAKAHSENATELTFKDVHFTNKGFGRDLFCSHYVALINKVNFINCTFDDDLSIHHCRMPNLKSVTFKECTGNFESAINNILSQPLFTLENLVVNDLPIIKQQEENVVSESKNAEASGELLPKNLSNNKLIQQFDRDEEGLSLEQKSEHCMKTITYNLFNDNFINDIQAQQLLLHIANHSFITNENKEIIIDVITSISLAPQYVEELIQSLMGNDYSNFEQHQ